MVTESKISIEEYMQWKSAQTNYAYSSRDTPEDSDDEIGELIYQQSCTGKAIAKASASSAFGCSCVDNIARNKMVTKRAVLTIDEYIIRWKSAQIKCLAGGCKRKAQAGGKCIKHGGKLKDNRYKFRGEPEDSDEEIGELIYQQSRTRKTGAEAENCCDFTNQASILKYFKCYTGKGRLLPLLYKLEELDTQEAKCNYMCSWRNMTKPQQEQYKAKERRKREEVRKTCKVEGCTKQAQKDGVCYRHGAKRTMCATKGCDNQALKGGVCWRHGASKL